MNYFYNHTFKNITVALMSLFNNIEVRRYDDSGNVSKTIKVPIKFGPQSKYYQRKKEDESGQRQYIQLPTIAIVPTGFTFDANRSVSSKEDRMLIDPDNLGAPEEFLINMMPAPWDVTFSVYIRTEEFQDFLQIVEQIIPFFQPSIYLRVKEFNTINLERDIKVTLNSMTPELADSFEEDERREVNGTMDLTAQAWFYGPLTSAKIIKSVKSTYGFNPGHNTIDLFQTNSMATSAAEAIVTSATVTTGIIDTSVIDLTDRGYVHFQED